MLSTLWNRYEPAVPRRAGLAMVFVASLVSTIFASDAPSWRVTRAEVRVTCPMFPSIETATG